MRAVRVKTERGQLDLYYSSGQTVADTLRGNMDNIKKHFGYTPESVSLFLEDVEVTSNESIYQLESKRIVHHFLPDQRGYQLSAPSPQAESKSQSALKKGNKPETAAKDLCEEAISHINNKVLGCG